MPQSRTHSALATLRGLGRESRLAVLWAMGQNFFLFSAYYTLRPVRDEVSSQYLDLRDELFRNTFFATTLAALGFALLTRWIPRGRLVKGTFAVLLLNLVGFRILLPGATEPANPVLEQSLYVWINVFVFIGSTVFWSQVSDTFRSNEAKSVYGLFFFSSTAGNLLASGAVTAGAQSWSRAGVLNVGIALVCGTTLCTWKMVQLARQRNGGGSTVEQTPLRNPLRGLASMVSSPQLRSLCIYLFTFTCASTILYFIKTDMVGAAFSDRNERVAFFARLDLFVGIGCLLPQLFLTGQVMLRGGLSRTLMILPAVTIVGFVVFALIPSFTVLVILESARRAVNFVFAKPSREVLYTGVTTEERFQAKPIIDTAWYRGMDWLESSVLGSLAMGPVLSAWVGVPITLGGLWLGLRMGQRHEQGAQKADR